MLAVFAAALLAAAAGAEASETISSVSIERRNVFDPAVRGEDWWPFQVANRIHAVTRESIIAHDNLLPPGSVWDELKALETERNLRRLGFLRSAAVSRTAKDDGSVHVGIVTQDSWSLVPQISAGTEGGDQYLTFGVSEGNLLGLGKAISLYHSQTGPEIRNDLRYSDPRLAGTWNELTAQFADTSKGSEAGTRIARPFFSLETPTAWEASWARVVQDESLHQNASIISQFDHDFRGVRTRFGRRVGRFAGAVHRSWVGSTHDRSSFGANADTRPGTLPKNRELSGPTVGHSWIVPRYTAERNLDRMQRTEDYNLGSEFSIETGPLLKSWGSDRDRWSLDGSLQQGIPLGNGRFALAEAGAEGRLAGGEVENGILYSNLNLFWKTGWLLDQTLAAHAEFNTTQRLDGERELILGGDSGLRGYKNNAFTGKRSLLLNLEDRLFWDRELCHLVYMGGVLFLDSGITSSPGGKFEGRVKSDLGAGLRFSPSRSTTGGVVRIDLAYALQDGPGSGRWVLSVRGGHAFSLFGSANRKARSRPDSSLSEGAESIRPQRR